MREQCEYCGVDFDSDKLAKHQMLVHDKTLGEVPVPDGSTPGTIYRPKNGPPQKVRYSWDWARKNLVWGEYEPPERIPVTWQGITFIFVPGIVNHAPEQHISMARDYFRSLQRGALPAEAASLGVERYGTGMLDPV